MKVNINKIVADIVLNKIFNEKNTFCTHYSIHKNPIIAYFDYSSEHINDFVGKWVVYLIRIGNRYYIGITDCLSRRIQEHISKNCAVCRAAKKHRKILYKVLYVGNSKDEVRNVEKNINKNMQYHKSIHINIVK